MTSNSLLPIKERRIIFLAHRLPFRELLRSWRDCHPSAPLANHHHRSRLSWSLVIYHHFAVVDLLERGFFFFFVDKNRKEEERKKGRKSREEEAERRGGALRRRSIFGDPQPIVDDLGVLLDTVQLRTLLEESEVGARRCYKEKKKGRRRREWRKGRGPLTGATPLVTPKITGVELGVPPMQRSWRTSQEKTTIAGILKGSC